MKKLIAVLMVVFVVLGLMAGCGGDESSDTGSDVQATNGIISKADVVYVNDGESVYKIIRPEDAKLDETNRAGYIFKQMKNILGVTVKNETDNSNGTDQYEILVGHTNRPESKQALDYLVSKTGGRYDDFIVCTIGKKIVINATGSAALEAATKYFVDNYIKIDGIKGGIEYCKAAEGNFANYTINGTDISKFRFVRPHFNLSYLAQTEMEKLVNTICEKTGYMLTIEEDAYTEAGDYEIIVGNNNRPGIKAIANYDEYDITIKGNKIYLNGGSAHATAMAVSEFAKILEKGSVTDADSVSGSYEAAMANYDRSTTYYPVYYDNFDGDTIDTTKWRLMKGKEFGRDGQNGKFSGMTDDPNFVYQRDGKFWIYGHENDEGYWGGTLTNNTTMAFQYGFVEHSVICPDGDGFWSLLWFSSTGDGTNQYYRAEIDLNECFGNGRATQANCHKWPTGLGTANGLEHESLDGKQYGNAKKYWCPDEKTWADDFHTFGFLWDETQMTFTADGKIWFSYDITTTEYDIDAFVNTYLFMKLSFSVGRLNNNLLVNNLTEEEWRNTSKLVCDWLYLYQLDNGKQTLLLK